MTNATKTGEATGKVIGNPMRNPFGCTLAVIDLTALVYVVTHFSTIWHLLDRLFGL